MRNKYSWKLFFGLPAGALLARRSLDEAGAKAGDSDVKIILVVAHQDVVFWAVFFDKFRFFQKCLNFRFGFNPFKFRCFLHKTQYFFRSVFSEIRSKPFLLIRGLA